MGDSMGFSDGGTNGHRVGLQIGLRSIADWHIASTRPLTHWHMQAAVAGVIAVPIRSAEKRRFENIDPCNLCIESSSLNI